METRAMRERRRPAAGGGFSLLEVMIALAIFSIGTLALIPLFNQASWGTRGGKELTVAKELAQTYIEKARNAPFTNVGIGTGCTAACTPPAAEVTANSPYVVTWAVTGVTGAAYNFATPPDPNMKRITVTVTCATCARKNLTVRMQTLIAERS